MGNDSYVEYRNISEYESPNGKRTAEVSKNLSFKNDYVVTVKDEAGSRYKATFHNLESAELFAEDWVLKDV